MGAGIAVLVLTTWRGSINWEIEGGGRQELLCLFCPHEGEALIGKVTGGRQELLLFLSYY